MMRKQRPRLGQHFLTSPRILERIGEVADIESARVLEIGPGKGTLTRVLARRADTVVTIEKDHTLVSLLVDNLPANVSIVEGDALAIAFTKNPLRAFRSTPYHVVANLPYYITARFLRRFLSGEVPRPKSMTLMIQREVARRIVGDTSTDASMLALMVHCYGKSRVMFTVPPGAFSPQPSVYSAVIRIENISDAFFSDHHIDPEMFFNLAKRAFQQKRKTLGRSLRNAVADTTLTPFAKKRPEELSREDWMTLYQGKNI